jgi:Cu/Ag efflux pump CusA
MALSDQLTTLAARTKLLEDRAAAAKSKAKLDLEQDVKRARESAQAQADGLRQNVEANRGRISGWWDNLQRSWNEHLTAVRQDIGEKRAAQDLKKAQRIADQAEADAEFALEFAYGAVEEAEYAVLDATLARMEADELAEG